MGTHFFPSVKSDNQTFMGFLQNWKGGRRSPNPQPHPPSLQLFKKSMSEVNVSLSPVSEMPWAIVEVFAVITALPSLPVIWPAFNNLSGKCHTHRPWLARRVPDALGKAMGRQPLLEGTSTRGTLSCTGVKLYTEKKSDWKLILLIHYYNYHIRSYQNGHINGLGLADVNGDNKRGK